MFNSNDNSMIWLLILFMLAGNNSRPFMPSTEELNKIFQDGIKIFLEDNKEQVAKASTEAPIHQLKELYDASTKIEDPEVNAKVLGVAMTIMKNVDLGDCCCCG